ncbi:MAG TPA: helix-turn-helix domain-containing protein [Solirubrobacteraceae bacterium]|jgi:hypothetical protein|nr:helix-turn-helix domain-containing protein [Solirubrobacteraceae bacterium]
MDQRAVCVQLTPGQVAFVVRSVQAGVGQATLAGQLSEQALRQAIPSISVWEAYERAVPEARASLALLRGLRLLARLAGGQPASLHDLASDLDLSPDAAGRYIRTLLVTGMVERDAGTGMYRLVR